MSQPGFEPTQISRIRRHPERGGYDEGSVFAVLDAAVLGHVGYVIDGQPFVTPTAYWRIGRRLYWHGAAASRMLRRLAQGEPACLAASLLDGLVLGPSGFVHSLNYRSVMAFGRARLVEGLEAKRAATDSFIERLYPGRTVQLRPATDAELKQISVIEMPIDEASAKTREGGVKAIDADEGWPAWSGVLPLQTRIGQPLADDVVGAAALGRAVPPPLAEAALFDAALSAAAAAQMAAEMS